MANPKALSSLAKATKSKLCLTYVRNKVDLVSSQAQGMCSKTTLFFTYVHVRNSVALDCEGIVPT